MDPVQIIKQQDRLGNEIANAYNALSTIAQSNISKLENRKSVMGLREKFCGLEEEFENNDKELRPPNSTLERNPYFKTNFVVEVREAIKNFNCLYSQLKLKFSQEDNLLNASVLEETTGRSEKVPTAPQFTPKSGIATSGLPPYSEKDRNNGLVRQFQYILDDFESKIDRFNNKEVSIDILKEKFKTLENIFIQYVGIFSDDEFTEVFYSLRDRYLGIPGIDSYAKSLPFNLPAIDLPKFSGKMVEWDTFRELFEELIIDQPYSNTQKMCVLKTKVVGDAAKKISKLSAKNENFETAWSILKDHYSNKRAATSMYFMSILDAPSVVYNEKSVKNFIEIINESVQALGAMKMEAEEAYQAFMCFVLQRKLDEKLRIQFEQHLGKSRDLPKLDNLIEFLNQMHYSLEASQQFMGGDKGINPSGNEKKSWEASQSGTNPSRYGAQYAQGASQKANPSKDTIKFKCPLGCAVGHALYKCTKFRNLPIKEKWDKVMEHNVCSRCLSSGHTKKACTSNFVCNKCNTAHHSLLHKEKIPQKAVLVNSDEDDEVILSTAIVEVKTGNGQWINCRVLLDGGSQVNIISKDFRSKLKLKGLKINKEFEGLQMKKSSAHEKVGINLRSKVSDYKTFLNAVVMKKFVSDVPNTKMMAGAFPDDISLADPKYYIPNGIDLLLSNQFIFDLICEGKIQDQKTKTKLQNTKLGWVAYSMTKIDGSKPEPNIVATVHESCDKILEKFWEIEEVPQINKLTVDEKECEKNFSENVKILLDGKFQVSLPFKNKPEGLGNSSVIAKRRFFALERKLAKNQELRVQYCDFLKQYLEMGHMELMTNNFKISSGYYLPHHCVLKPESTSTKLRVVFDASCKTTTNMSLNDILHTGPRIQEDLFNILLRFRKHRYVFSADIEKMYRQIWVSEADRKYQLIFWRWNPNENLQTYALQTVTYGTSSAPYLAVKCLQKIADWKSNQFPTESESIRNDFYMDDLMTGGDCLKSVKAQRANINNIMQEFGMPLRKWCSNEKSLLEGVDEKDMEVNLEIQQEQLNSVKALGVIWTPKSDLLGLRCKWPVQEKITKRTILSEVAKMFDPLGLIGPVIVMTKILLQELWKLKLDWDEKVPEEIASKWKLIKDNFSCLNQFTVPRHIICVKPTQIEIYGFCDASMKAYGAAVYIRSVDSCGNVYTHLAASKSRVAPIKTITLPRLELCASVLLVDLVKTVVESLKLEFQNIYYYTDSTIVLSWIKMDPARLHIFVSNRVSTIQENSDVSKWRHVRSEENPADLISRGLLGKEILTNKFWFEGPKFLKGKILNSPSSPVVNEIPEIKNRAKILVIEEKDAVCRKIHHKNNFKFLQNVMAYVVKFINIIRKGPTKPFIEYRRDALIVIVQEIQRDNFLTDLKVLKARKALSKTSNLVSLWPILDENNIIRVGGRLENSNLSYNSKHPILLPYKDKIVELLIEHLHVQHLHVGPQGLLAIVRQQFWPLRGRQLIKKIISKCYRCFKVKPTNIHQLMGNLPKDRVIRTRPFLNVGIDFLGPITIHHKVRGKKTDKAYVCVFVCFATKAVHLEVVSDMTSAAFIGALKRFVARRGCPLKVYSDNGTNFVGAANSLNEIFHLFASEQHKANLNEFCTQGDIIWLNIPARSPHVGGLWEACVKSVKTHFYKVTEGTMTYEELNTLMTHIESVLNSRPLTPLSDDPNDFKVLTPGHFLIGESFTTFVDTSSNKCYHGLREHWKAVQSNSEEFWKRWSVEYLSELQKRYKWNKPFDNIKPGTLVLLKDDNTPPLSWRRGRVIRTIMGSDGLCRMVEVRTSNGETKRSIHNVCPFPAEENEDVLDKPSSNIKNSTKIKLNKRMDIPSLNTLNNEKLENKNTSKNHQRSGFCKKLKNKNMLTVLLSLLAIISPVRSQFIINNFIDKAGIFFEEVATVGLTKTSWNVVVHVNITEYAAAKASLDEAMISLTKVKGKQQQIDKSFTVQSLETAYERVLIKHDVIVSSTSTKRTKRAAIAFMGSIFHSLFGLMDEEHAEILANRIKTNERKEDYLLNIMKNQSSLQDMTLDIIKEQSKSVFKNMKTLSGSILVLEKSVNELKDTEAVLGSVTNMLASLESFEEIQSGIIEALLSSKNNVLTTIMPVKKFKLQIKMIKSSLRSNLRLPSENPVELVKISQVSAGITDEFIIFNIRIPLINNELFQAYEIYTYPTIHDGFSITLQQSSKYFLIDERKTVYYSLNDDNFNRCQPMKDIIICHQVHPVYNTRGTSNCEIKLFLKSRKIPENCELAIKRLHNFWQQTHTLNTWIFSLYEKIFADIICSGKRHSVYLQGSGILKMQPDCYFESNEVNLWAYDSYNTNVNYLFPNLNLSTLMPALRHLKLNAEIEVYKIPDIPKPSAIFGFPTHLDVHHLAHYGISTTTIIIIIIIIIVLIWILSKLCKMSARYLPATVALPRLM